MLQKVKSVSLVEDVVRQIEDAILDLHYKPGDRLPSSRELQSILGASQGTIREAVAILEQKSLVEVRKGSKGGIFVREATTDPVTEGLARLIRYFRISPQELAEFRQSVESELVGLVIERATDKEIEGLSHYRREFADCLNREKEGWDSLLEIEARLRKELIVLARNRLYEAVLVPIHDNIFTFAKRFLHGNDEYTQEAYDDWIQILTALENRDTKTCIEVTRSHIERFLAHMLQTVEREKTTSVL